MTALHPGLFYYDDEDKLEETIEYIPKQIKIECNQASKPTEQLQYFKTSVQNINGIAVKNLRPGLFYYGDSFDEDHELRKKKMN